MSNVSMNVVNENSSIAELAARHNFLSGQVRDVKTLAKRGRLKLLDQIRVMEAALESSQVEEQAEAQVAEQVVAVEEPKIEIAPKTKTSKKDKGTKKEKGPVIRVVAEALLLEVVSYDDDKRPYGHSYETILNEIRKQFEGAKTSVACLRWYAVHMRERGEKVPNRPRAQPTKKAPVAKEA